MSTLGAVFPIGCFALNVLLLCTAVCLAVFALARLVFARNPGARYVASVGGLICVMASPIIAWIQPAPGLSLIHLQIERPFAGYMDSSDKTPKGMSAAHNSTPFSHEAIDLWIAAGLAVWLTGTAWGTIRIARGYAAIERLRARMCSSTNPAISETRDSLEQSLGRILPPIFESPDVSSPAAAGLIRPYVIMPDGLTEELTAHQLRQVLLHEAGHIALGHLRCGLIERLARTIYWPVPTLQLMCGELGRAREEVCDNFALQDGGVACYAHTLLAIAQRNASTPAISSTLALLGPEIRLDARIAGLLDPRRDRMIHASRKSAAVAICTIAIVAIGAAGAVRVVAQPKDESGKAPVNLRQDPAVRVAEKDGRWQVVKDGRSGADPVVVKDGLWRVEKDGRSGVDPIPSGSGLAVITSDADKPVYTHYMQADLAEQAAKHKAEAEARAHGKLPNGSHNAGRPLPGQTADQVLTAKHEAEAGSASNVKPR